MTTSMMKQSTTSQLSRVEFLKKTGAGTMAPRRQKVDPLRALEPARKKLTSIESQRIMAVLTDTIRRIECASLFPAIIDQLARFSIMLGQELVALFQEHAVLMSSFKELKIEAEKLISSESKRQSDIRSHIVFTGDLTMEEITKQAGSDQNIIDIQMAPISRSASRSQSRQRAASRHKSILRKESEKPSASAAAAAVAGMTHIGTIPIPLDLDDLDNAADNNADNNAHIRANEEKLKEVINVTDNSVRCEAAIKQLMLVAKEMQNSCRMILRCLFANPSALISLAKENINQRTAIREMLLDMSELRNILNNKLLTTPLEEVEKNDYIQMISKRDQINTTNIKKLSKELDLAVADKNEEIRKKNDIIRKLQSELYLLEKYSDENIRRTRNDADKQEAADIKNSDGKKQKLNTEVNTLKSSHQNLIDEHRVNESVLRKKKFKVETECENWIQKYDGDMSERQDEFEMIDQVYTEEKKQLCELEERFKTLETEYISIQEERTIERNKRELEDQKMKTKQKAVTTIQAFWRSYKVRKALKTKKKPGKGKKGKK